MSIPIEEHLPVVQGMARRDAVLYLLTAKDGPLTGAESSEADAAPAYLLAVLFREARRSGLLSSRPAYEARDLFASRIRQGTRVATDPMAWPVKLARSLRVKWESIAESDRVWWRTVARSLSGDGVKPRLTSDWSRLRQPERLADVITSAMIAEDWIRVLEQR